jgi:hypothetical protein
VLGLFWEICQKKKNHGKNNLVGPSNKDSIFWFPHAHTRIFELFPGSERNGVPIDKVGFAQLPTSCDNTQHVQLDHINHYMSRKLASIFSSSDIYLSGFPTMKEGSDIIS